MKSDLIKTERIKPEITGYITKSLSLLKTGTFPDAKRIHDVRVMLKKARALFRIIYTQMDEDFADRCKKSLRDAGRIMSPWREAPVLWKTLDSLAKEYPSVFSQLDYGISELITPISPQSDTHQRKKELQDVLLLLYDTASDLLLKPLKNPDLKLVETELDKSWAITSYNYLLSRAEPEIRNIHEFRKRSKDLMYQIDFFGSVSGRDMKKLKKKLYRITSEIGKFNDLFLLGKKLRSNDDENKKVLMKIRSIISEKQDKYLSSIMSYSSGIFNNIRCYK
jgi:CHAD domain-containing protein